MKKKVLIIVLVIILLILFGFITWKKDSERVNNNIEPKFTIKFVSKDGSKITYLGLGYKVIRYVGVSPNEPFKNNIGVKLGSWFMKFNNKKTSDETDSVSLILNRNTLTSKGASFILKNSTSMEFSYGPEYTVERYVNNKWNEVDTLTGDPLTWNTVVYTLKANEEKELNIDWALGYGELTSGKYRIVKKIINNETKEFYVFSEFEI